MTHPEKTTADKKGNLQILLHKATSLNKSGDFHLEHLWGEWAASLCHWPDNSPKNVRWYVGKTPEEAIQRLLAAAKRRGFKPHLSKSKLHSFSK